MKRLTFAAAAMAAAAMFGVSACGGDESPDTGAQQPAQGTDKLAECMREHGVNIPDPPAEGDTKEGDIARPEGPKAKIEAARAACAKYAPSGENEDLTEEDQDKALKKAECLRKQGIKAQDPKPGTVDITIEEGSVDDDKLVEAFTVCNKEVGDTES